ncbi:MAG: winged helix-turn-helix transcriptional regulator [Chitinophagaceae bacterium]|nr:winged helix-turn-helix transcriptional regulator [Chitinophagaceae bacterium]
MNYSLLKEIIDLIAQFELATKGESRYPGNKEGFKCWIKDSFRNEDYSVQPKWEGKENGRSPESVISTLIVHMNRYAKAYSKSAIHGSGFSTQDEYIYLINLKAFGEMTKMDLIKKNIHEKPVGIQIINRLIYQGWISQRSSSTDKRSKIIKINSKGLKALEQQMNKIRQATRIVSGNLSYSEKIELIRLLTKLDDYHHPIFCKDLAPAGLLNTVMKDYPINKN